MKNRKILSCFFGVGVRVGVGVGVGWGRGILKQVLYH